MILAGPSGAGKSTVGRALADELGWAFVDADDLHAPASVAMMRAGVPVTDAERWPWLERVRDVIRASAREGRQTVVACSALRERYRTFLIGDDGEHVRFVFLSGSRELLEDRLRERKGHFAPAALLESQLDATEEPNELVLDASLPVPVLVERIRRLLDL